MTKAISIQANTCFNANKCQDCYYYGSQSGTCDYLLIVGKRRGCPIGEECTKHRKVLDGEKITLVLPNPPYPFWYDDI